MSRDRPTFSGVALVALIVLGAIATPADGKPKPCRLFTPGVEEARDAPIAQLTDAATVETPLTIEIDHPASLPVAAEGHAYFNLQVYSRRAHPGIYVREHFDNQSDIDLYLYDNSGKEVDASTAFNLLPVNIGPIGDPDSGAVGYESIDGFRVGRCDQYTLESRSMITQGTVGTLKIWLGHPI